MAVADAAPGSCLLPGTSLFVEHLGDEPEVEDLSGCLSVSLSLCLSNKSLLKQIKFNQG